MKDETVPVRFMADACRKIKSYVEDMSFDDFAKDEKTQSAVIMQLQVVGEMAKRTSLDIQSKIDIPQVEMAGLRDIVSHNYFSLRLQSIWQTATEDVPAAQAKIAEYVTNL